MIFNDAIWSWKPFSKSEKNCHSTLKRTMYIRYYILKSKSRRVAGSEKDAIFQIINFLQPSMNLPLILLFDIYTILISSFQWSNLFSISVTHQWDAKINTSQLLNHISFILWSNNIIRFILKD